MNHIKRVEQYVVQAMENSEIHEFKISPRLSHMALCLSWDKPQT